MEFNGFNFIDESNATTLEGILSPVASEKKAELSAAEMERQMLLSPIVGEIRSRYNSARDARMPVENTWLANMLQWRGIFSPEEAAAIARAKERNVYASAVYIKITKTKVTSALGQIIDILFDNDNIPISIEPTPRPDGVPEVAFIAPEDYPEADPYGHATDGKSLPPGATTASVMETGFTKLKNLLAGKKIIEGASPDPASMPVITPAEEAADKMEKTILDQMEEGNIKREIRYALWECVVLGTGIMKGPVTYEQVTHKWNKNPQTGKNEYIPEAKYEPRSSYASIWNIYPDPNTTRIEDAQFVIEKHLKNRSQMSGLKRYAGVDTTAIDRLLIKGPGQRSQESWEMQIKDSITAYNDDRYEMLEYWGYLERDMVEAFQKYSGVEFDLEAGADQFQVNIWICQDEIIRLVINPFVPQRIPYYAIPYEEHTQQIWGIAIPENMRDAQVLMNGHYRMMVDNLALAGNCIFEVNENYLSPGQDLTMYPGKVIRTNNGAPGQSIFSLSFNNTSQSHMMAFDKARQMADEVSGQPSYAQGVATTTGATRTAAGMSMLMGAAASNIRQVVKQWDEYFFRPIGEAYFNWNMQNNDDAEIKGDVRIVAGGTASLMRREVMSQRLLQFAQAVGANPAIAPRVNWDMWVKEFAKSINLNSDKFLNDPKQAMIAAQMMAMAGGAGPGQAPSAGPQPGGPSAADQTGGGGQNIGVGAATQPGEPQFTGNQPSVQ